MPITSLGSPLNVSGGSGTSDITGNIDDMTGQVNNQTKQFGGMLQDPSFNGQSQMASFLKLQQAAAQEQMMYQATSNIIKMRSDNAKNAISNMH
jgi:hypothetical protein